MTVVTKGTALPEFDAYCPIMSLPYVFKTTLETVPSVTPYLSSDARKVQKWKATLQGEHRLKVGLVWSGSEKHKNDMNRSIRLEDLLPLTDLPAEWHSLQKDIREHDADKLRQHPEIHQHQSELNDFSDTAALIQCLDLVISVDTSVAHVAGALGKPVWILLPFLPDYRWLLDREDSPWYPSARLFRQPKIGDWRSVVEMLRRVLEERV
jgi:ADP-heptose:LPS heptosyltransferase